MDKEKNPRQTDLIAQTKTEEWKRRRERYRYDATRYVHLITVLVGEEEGRARGRIVLVKLDENDPRNN